MTRSSSLVFQADKCSINDLRYERAVKEFSCRYRYERAETKEKKKKRKLPAISVSGHCTLHCEVQRYVERDTIGGTFIRLLFVHVTEYKIK